MHAASDVEFSKADKIVPGCDMKDALGLGYFRGSFIVFGGGPMKQEWIDEYTQQAMSRRVCHLQGPTSCYLDLAASLKFAFRSDPDNPSCQPVLFVFTI